MGVSETFIQIGVFLSKFSPIIIPTCILFVCVFTLNMAKFGWYLFALFIGTTLRSLIVRIFRHVKDRSSDTNNATIEKIVSVSNAITNPAHEYNNGRISTLYNDNDYHGGGTGDKIVFTENSAYTSPGIVSSLCDSTWYPYPNMTYSLFVLCFTLAYIILSMWIVDGVVNYMLLGCLLLYILYDTVMKWKLCSQVIKNKTILLGDIFGGFVFGVCFAFFLAGVGLKRFLFANNTKNGSQSTCSMNSRDKRMYCRVYKNGELVTQSS